MKHTARATAVLAGLLMTGGLVAAEGEPAGPPELVLLEDRSYFGRALFARCTLTVGLVRVELPADLGVRATASLACWPHADDLPPLRATREVATEEATELLTAVAEARLFAGGHIGGDSRQGDGTLRVLHATVDSRSVALVVSDNDTFEAAGPRRDLAERLASIERELLESARR